MPSISQFFRQSLDAPLANPRWSWGSRRADGSIVMRAWDDEIRPIDGHNFIRLANHAEYAGASKNLGYRERLQHLSELANGASGFVVVCTAVSTTPRSRRIRKFDQDGIWRIGEVRLVDGDEHGEMLTFIAPA